MPKKVLVLMGGWSAEREVSLVSGAAVLEALKTLGYTVSAVDVQYNVATVLTRLNPKPDIVFNALHGRVGEDGCIQGILNILGIPYTHSGLIASAIAMNKPVAKRLFVEAGIPVSSGLVVYLTELFVRDPLPRPYIIKPLNEGSSVGVRVVHAEDNIEDFSSWSHGRLVLVESFIPGRELTVAVLGGKALEVTEIVTNRSFYDYKAKYAVGYSHHLLPAPILEDTRSKVQQLASLAYRTLGCRSVSRVDFRYDGVNLVLLEVNTQPGMTPTSLVPEQASHVGINFTELVQWMVENATCDE